MKKELEKLIAQTMKAKPTLIKDQAKQGEKIRVMLDSPQLNYAFGGCWTTGISVQLYGPYSSGKTSLANYIGGQLQRKLPLVPGHEDQNVVVFGDFERSFNKEFATQNGLLTDREHFIYMTPDTLEDFVDDLTDKIKTGAIAQIILDSEAAAPTRQMMTDPAGKANFGAGAKAVSEMLKKFNILCANYDTSFLIISQERENMCVSETTGVEWEFVENC